MSDLIGGSKSVPTSAKQALREKYQKETETRQFKGLTRVPPHLQKHTQRFIDGKSKGLGTSPKQKSISVLYPIEMENALRAISDRSDYIRRAVLEKLHKDGLVLDYELPELD